MVVATGVMQANSRLSCVGQPQELAKADISKHCSVLHTGFQMTRMLLSSYSCNLMFPEREQMNNMATWPPPRPLLEEA